MAVNNTLAPKDNRPLTFNQSLAKGVYQDLINNAFRDSKKADQFVTSILSLVQATPALEKCEHRSIVIATLQGVAMGLNPSPAVGDFWVVPRKRKRKNPLTEKWEEYYQANFQLGLGGRKELAYRSGLYVDIDTREVVEGEFKGLSKQTGAPIIEFISDPKIRKTKPVIGYFAYYILKDTGGYVKSCYLSNDESLDRAKRSDAFDVELYNKYISGEKLTYEEDRSTKSPWYQWYSRMAQNATLKELLRNAPKSAEMKDAEATDNESYISLSKTDYSIANDEKQLPQAVEDEFFNKDEIPPTQAPKKTQTKTTAQE